ncbi:putative sodium/metabolite cotransporter BASS1, chloroplastic, partial [Mucuna pruriens]
MFNDLAQTRIVIFYKGKVHLGILFFFSHIENLTLQIMTPFLTAKLAGKYVAVDAYGLVISTLQVVLFPVLAGAFLNQFFQPIVKFVSPLMPPIAVTTVAILCGNAIAQSSSAIIVSGGQVILATFLLQASGFFFGYIFARLIGLDVSSSRTISTQVGMKNCVLEIVLATKHFGDPLTAVPGAVAIVSQSFIGSILAGIWTRSVPL